MLRALFREVGFAAGVALMVGALTGAASAAAILAFASNHRGWEVAAWILLSAAVLTGAVGVLVIIVTVQDLAARRARSLKIESIVCDYYPTVIPGIRVEALLFNRLTDWEVGYNCQISVGEHHEQLMMDNAPPSPHQTLSNRYIYVFRGRGQIAAGIDSALIKLAFRETFTGINASQVRDLRIRRH